MSHKTKEFDILKMAINNTDIKLNSICDQQQERETFLKIKDKYWRLVLPTQFQRYFDSNSNDIVERIDF